MLLEDLSRATVDIIYKELELTDQDVKDYVKMLKEWLHKQPHLPHVDGK
jgi:hypothetical protein